MPDVLADPDLACAATGLYLYPVKACAPCPVDSLVLDARGGAVGDRGWAIVDADGAVTWQGSFPRLALVHPRLDGERLTLRADGAAAIAAPAHAELAPVRIKIWSDLKAGHEVFDAADAGDAVAAWLHAVVGAPLRLVRLGEDALAREGTNALHLVFSASVAAVDAALADSGRSPTDTRRFRANVVLALPPGAGQAFIEESLAALEWDGGTRLDITAPCVRCVVPNVDPVSAQVDDGFGDTLTRLSQQRRPGATVFGVYARGPAGACLRVGDAARMEIAF